MTAGRPCLLWKHALRLDNLTGSSKPSQKAASRKVMLRGSYSARALLRVDVAGEGCGSLAPVAKNRKDPASTCGVPAKPVPRAGPQRRRSRQTAPTGGVSSGTLTSRSAESASTCPTERASDSSIPVSSVSTLPSRTTARKA